MMRIGFSKSAGVAIIVMTLAGCARDPIQQRQVQGPTARVRIDHGLPIALYPGAACYKSSNKDDERPYSSPFTYTVGPKVVDSKAITLGMPMTSTTPELHNEYYLEANRPSIVSVSYSDYLSGYGGAPSISTTCGPIYVSFTPEESKDYEVIGIAKTLGPLNQRMCVAEINEIVRTDNGGYRLKPILPRPALPCSATDGK